MMQGMENSKSKVIVIVGPTASGKTDLAFDLSHYFPGEVVNADSKQVYAGIDIIPGKDIPADAVFVPSEMQIDANYNIGYFAFDEVRIWLLDIVSPQQEFSVYDFIQVAPSVISHIQEHNRMPIVVGGSGFYIKALIDGIDTLDIPQNLQLRLNLENRSIDELQTELERVNPVRWAAMNESDRQNKRRLIRAIEIAEFQSNQSPVVVYSGLKSDVRIIGLKVDRDEIRKRVDYQIEKRIHQGAIDEAKSLYERRDEISSTVKSIYGIEPLFSYFDGQYSYEDAIQKWKYSGYLIAKKQMTWFQKDPRIIWYDVSDNQYKQKIINDVRNWLGYETRSEY